MNTILMGVLFAIVYICIGAFATAMIKKFFAGDWSICVFIWPIVGVITIVGGLGYLSYRLGTFIATGLIGMMGKESDTE